MTPEERELMNTLCREIQDEKDPKRFSELVRELDEVLARKDERLNEKGASLSSSPSKKAYSK